MDNAPSDVRLYTVEWWDPTAGPDQFHIVEEQIRGSAGEVGGINPDIPWDGAFGTNHEWLTTETSATGAGVFRQAGPGPHSPDSAAQNAEPDGPFMWLRNGSQI